MNGLFLLFFFNLRPSQHCPGMMRTWAVVIRNEVVYFQPVKVASATVFLVFSFF